MPDYILFMRDDTREYDDAAWEPYLRGLRERQAFEGGSAIGGGVCARKAGAAPPITEILVGYVRVTAADLDGARALLIGNPHFEAGGTVEIRELPRSD